MRILFTFLLSSAYLILFGQASEQSYAVYQVGFEFKEGIYLSFEEFKANMPQLRYPIKKIGKRAYYTDASDSLIEITATNVWGYSFEGNIYISRNELFWKCINIGQLTQFTAIESNTFRTVDTYGFYNEVQTQSLQQSFLEMETGLIRKMNYKNLKPYIDKEPTLSRYVKNKRKARYGELILVLKAYNKLNPLYFPIYE